MHIKSDLADAVGNTPLIKLRAASEATGCTILGKASGLRWWVRRWVSRQ